MIPEFRFSSQTVDADFMLADELSRARLTDFEMGGIALSNPSQGLRVQPWQVYLVGQEVRVRPHPNGPPTTIFKEAGIRRVELAFDQNMRPVIAYVANDLVKLRWYDPVTAKATTTSFPGARDPIVMLDDKRPGLLAYSDVLFFYLKAGRTLYMRAQQDRFGVEYAIGDFPIGTTTLDAGGMSKNGRLKFRVFGKFPKPGGGRRDIPGWPPGKLPPGYRPGLNLVFDDVPYAPIGGGFAPLKFEFELYQPPLSDVIP